MKLEVAIKYLGSEFPKVKEEAIREAIETVFYGNAERFNVPGHFTVLREFRNTKILTQKTNETIIVD